MSDPLHRTRTRDVSVKDLPHVSPREKLLLRRFAKGMTDRKIAEDLGGTASGIEAQRQRIAKKFHIQTDEQLREAASRLAYWGRVTSSE